MGKCAEIANSMRNIICFKKNLNNFQTWPKAITNWLKNWQLHWKFLLSWLHFKGIFCAFFGCWNLHQCENSHWGQGGGGLVWTQRAYNHPPAGAGSKLLVQLILKVTNERYCYIYIFGGNGVKGWPLVGSEKNKKKPKIPSINIK